MVDGYMNIEEVSEYVGLPIYTIYFYVSKTQIPHYQVGERLLFLRPEINEWFKSYEVSAEGNS